MDFTIVTFCAMFAVQIEFIYVAAYDIPIGVVLDDVNDEVRSSVQLSIDQHNAKSLYLKLLPKYVNISQKHNNNLFHLEQTICGLMSDGLFALFARGHSDTFLTLNAISQTFHIPFFTWNTPQQHIDRINRSLEVNFRALLHEAIADVIISKSWTQLIYVYDTADGIASLQRLTEIVRSKRNTSFAADLRRVDASGVRAFFERLHSRVVATTPQRVVVDISESDTQRRALDELAVLAASSARNVHYIIASHAVSDQHLKRFASGFLNVTAFRLANRDTNSEFKQLVAMYKKQHSLTGDVLVLTYRLANIPKKVEDAR